MPCDGCSGQKDNSRINRSIDVKRRHFLLVKSQKSDEICAKMLGNTDILTCGVDSSVSEILGLRLGEELIHKQDLNTTLDDRMTIILDRQYNQKTVVGHDGMHYAIISLVMALSF